MAGAPFQQVLVHARRMAGRLEADKVTDRELLEAFTQDRDQSAFESLVNRHGPMVQAVCCQHFRDSADADDAFQATFCVLARKASSIRKAESVSSWLYGVAVRTARHCQAANARRQFCERQHARSEVVQAIDSMTWGELRAIFDEELARISTAYRSPLLLCLLEGCTQEEAAQQLGLSQRTLRRRFKLGRALMQQRLARRGLALSTGLAATLLTGNHSVAAPSALLVRTTVTAAVSAAVRPGLGAAVSHRVAGLVAQAMRSHVLGQMKHAFSIMVLASVFVAGGGMIALNFIGLDESGQTETEERVPEGRRSGLQAKEQAAQVGPPRDQFGDPLPAHVISRLGSMRLRHGGGAYAAAFSPDGRRLASVSPVDKKVRIWDAATGRELLCIDDTEESRRAGVHTPDGKTLITSWTQTGGPVRSWALDSESEITSKPRLPLASATDILMGADGRTFATLHPDTPEACLWDMASGKLQLRLKCPQQRPASLGYSPDGKLIAVGGYDGILSVWDASIGKLLHQSKPGPDLTYLTFSADGQTIFWASQQENVIHALEAISGKERYRLEGQPGRINSLAVSRDGKRLVSTGDDGTGLVWDLTEIRTEEKNTPGDK